MVVLSVLQFHYVIHREMTETVAAATGQDNPGAVSEHDVNALAAHQVRLESFTQIQILEILSVMSMPWQHTRLGALHQ